MQWHIQSQICRVSPVSLQWRHNVRDGIYNHQPRNCLLNRLLRRKSKKTSKFRITALCAGNSPVTGEFPAQRASNAEKVSIWWRHHYAAQIFTTWCVSNAERTLLSFYLHVVQLCTWVHLETGMFPHVQLYGEVVMEFLQHVDRPCAGVHLENGMFPHVQAFNDDCCLVAPRHRLFYIPQTYLSAQV